MTKVTEYQATGAERREEGVEGTGNRRQVELREKNRDEHFVC